MIFSTYISIYFNYSSLYIKTKNVLDRYATSFTYSNIQQQVESIQLGPCLAWSRRWLPSSSQQPVWTQWQTQKHPIHDFSLLQPLIPVSVLTTRISSDQTNITKPILLEYLQPVNSIPGWLNPSEYVLHYFYPMSGAHLPKRLVSLRQRTMCNAIPILLHTTRWLSHTSFHGYGRACFLSDDTARPTRTCAK